MNTPENGPTPPEVDFEHKRAQFIPRGRGRMDLVHAGRPSNESMEARQDAFLFKNRELVARRENEETAELAASIIRRYGWNR